MKKILKILVKVLFIIPLFYFSYNSYQDLKKEDNYKSEKLQIESLDEVKEKNRYAVNVTFDDGTELSNNNVDALTVRAFKKSKEVEVEKFNDIPYRASTNYKEKGIREEDYVIKNNPANLNLKQLIPLPLYVLLAIAVILF